MAVAWQRLREGNFLPRDILLLQHEQIFYCYNMNFLKASLKRIIIWIYQKRMLEQLKPTIGGGD